MYIFFRKSQKIYHTQCKYHQVKMQYWNHRKGEWGKEWLQGRYRRTAAAASICVSACAGQMLHLLVRVLLVNGQPSMTNEFLRTLHFSCTEPGLPEPVKLAQEPTGENSKAWIKARGENHPAPVWTSLHLTHLLQLQGSHITQNSVTRVPYLAVDMEHKGIRRQGHKAWWDENNHLLVSPSTFVFTLFTSYFLFLVWCKQCFVSVTKVMLLKYFTFSGGNKTFIWRSIPKFVLNAWRTLTHLILLTQTDV